MTQVNHNDFTLVGGRLLIPDRVICPKRGHPIGMPPLFRIYLEWSIGDRIVSHEKHDMRERFLIV